MKQSYNHPTLGPIEIERVARARNIRISVRNECVRVAYPWFSSRERALQFLETKLDWVIATLTKQREKAAQRLIRPPFRTRQHELVVLCDPNCTLPSVRITSDKVTVRHHPDSDITDSDVQQIINRGVTEALRSEAKEYLPARVKELAQRTGLGFRSVSVRATQVL